MFSVNEPGGVSSAIDEQVAGSAEAGLSARHALSVGPLNRRLDSWRQRLPPVLQPWLPSIPPPTLRNLWLLLALLVATQNSAVFHTSQSANVTVLAVMIWGGALICIEDQLDELEPNPGLIGLLFGSTLLLWVLARSAVILHWDGLIFLLAPLGGLALALLCLPLRQLGRFRDPLLCLLLLPSFALLMRVLPEEPLSVLTARGAGFWLSILGLDVVVRGRSVMLPGGGVQVLAECNGLDMMAQILCVGLIFMLAFRIRSGFSRLLLFAAAPAIGLVCNTFRIALLAGSAGIGQGKGTSGSGINSSSSPQKQSRRPLIAGTSSRLGGPPPGRPEATPAP